MIPKPVDNDQRSTIRKERRKAYFTSGAILVLSLLMFFVFHKSEDDKNRLAMLALGDRVTQLENEKADLERRLQTAQEASNQGGNRNATNPALTPAPLSTPTVASPEEIVYITGSGEKYHRKGCKRSQKPINKKDAIAKGYRACHKCNP
jgi:hypothetical protein